MNRRSPLNMEDVYKVIDDIHMKNIEQLDEKVNRVLQSDDHDALFMLGETLYKYGIVDQGVKYLKNFIYFMKMNYSFII